MSNETPSPTDANAAPSTVRRLWRIAQPILLLLVLFYVARAFYLRWADVRDASRNIDVQWLWVSVSCVVVLATYGVLVESWRLLIRATGGTLPYATAVKIWTAANLGRYLPGKVWSIGALGVLAQREGVPGWVAASAAVIGTLLNIGAGFGVTALAATGSGDALEPYLRNGAVAGGIAFILGLALLPWLLPRAVAMLSRVLPHASAVRLPPVGAIWIAALVNTCSWIAYGVAFAFFAHGVTPDVTGSPMLFVAVFTASYVVGYLFLFAPGGIGVREVILQTMLVSFGMTDVGTAWLLSLLSRLWLTVLEILPGLAGLLLLSITHRRSVDRTAS